MTREEMIEQLENTILLIQQNGKDWWDERDIPILKEAIKSMQEQRWIPCKERLPEINQEVLVYLFGGNPYIAMWDGDDWQTSDFTLTLSEEPTAWMPLPEPYKKEKTNG